jgi:hypothetical protein
MEALSTVGVTDESEMATLEETTKMVQFMDH